MTSISFGSIVKLGLKFGVLFTSLVFFISVLSIILRTSWKSRKGWILDTRNSDRYQYSYRNTMREGVSFGILSTTEYIAINENSFVLYEEEEGKYSSLISTFGDIEYECSGSCFCDYYDDQEESSGFTSSTRRTPSSSSSAPLVRSLTFLVATVSSLVALRSSKSYFQEKCEETISNECPHDLIRSEVDSCEEITNLHSNMKEENEEEGRVYVSYEEEEEDIIEMKLKDDRFLCEGKCVSIGYNFGKIFKSLWIYNMFDRLEYFKLIKKSKEYCPKLRFSGEIDADDEYMAMEEFAKTKLDPFCRNSGLTATFDPLIAPKHSVHFCEGYLLSFWNKNEVKKIDLKCEKIPDKISV